MALHDFWCTGCGRVIVDHNVPIAIGAQEGAPPCPDCGGRTSWIPQVGRMDLRPDGDSAFQKFTTTDGRGNRVEIDSLHKLRQVERESEIAYRNGEGQPMVWRRYSQDSTNRDQHTLHQSLDGGEHPSDEAKRKFGSTLRKGEAVADAGFGPGVSEANASALGMGS